MGTAEILGGWALQGYLVVGHCRDTWWLVTKITFQSGEDDIYFKIEQPHCKGGEKTLGGLRAYSDFKAWGWI